ncbi:SIR2 family protein [uncultured Propionivibrio sp.]|uniref:SIR2 family protein n=1 Tax=uncultured Propionivibrio sp. TaxID=426737 RepID=UPI0029BFDC18|nr:SIR2 family protein [uncultured Propionivibrio sp.]
MDATLGNTLRTTLRTTLLSGLHDGSIVPYLGPGALADVAHKKKGVQMPATSEQLILAMNGGRPMAAKLMYEFSRAAMNVELKRGRTAVTRFLHDTYADREWSRASLHDWLQSIRPPYVIDINRDTQLLDSYAGSPHTLILGCARIAGTSYRFKLYRHDGTVYAPILPDEADPRLPVLFKPMGCPRPHPSYIGSDADYVDYITELMGGFAVPPFVKALRREKRYLLLGMRLNRDTERMVLSDLIHGAGSPAGWAMIADPTVKERRFLERIGIALIEDSWLALLQAETLT